MEVLRSYGRVPPISFAQGPNYDLATKPRATTCKQIRVAILDTTNHLKRFAKMIFEQFLLK